MDVVFTKHAIFRMEKRKITKDEVIDAIKYPEQIQRKQGNYCVRKNIDRANIEVVYEKDKYIKIITVYYFK
jgi:hypothetical protein